MNHIDRAARQLRHIDEMARMRRWTGAVAPAARLFVTFLYIAVTVSFHRYDLSGLMGMILYPLILFASTDLSFADAMRRLRFILPVVCAVGLVNPFLDRTILYTVSGVGIRGGVISMITLMLKAVLTVLAAYLLAATTPLDEICRAMRQLHFPQILVTVIWLIVRYITLLLEEASAVTTAYHLRAPSRKGIAMGEWGSLAGQMLLRSMDRAQVLYESMCLRGFRGEFPRQPSSGGTGAGWLYALIWTAVLLALRLFPVMQWIGQMAM